VSFVVFAVVMTGRTTELSGVHDMVPYECQSIAEVTIYYE